MKKTLLATLALLIAMGASAADLKKSVTWENLRNHPAQLPVIGELTPKMSSLDRPSLWSVGSETLDRDYAVFDNYIHYMHETGAGYARLQSGWAKTEPKVGKYNFNWLDHQVDGLIEEGIHPWLCLCYGNPAYTNLGYDLNAGIFTDGPVMEGWLKYVKQVIKRYKGKVTMYEVWNEPDGSKGEKENLNYAVLFAKTAKVIKETDPEAKVAAFGAFAIQNPKAGYFHKSLDKIRDLGAIDLIDYITYHAYWPNPDDIQPVVADLNEDVKTFNPNIILLQGECGCPGQLEYGHALRFREWTEYSQVKWDLRHMMVNFALGIPSSVFTMVDLDYGWMQQSFGLIRTNGKGEPVYKRPKFYGYQHMTSVVTADFSSDMTLKGVKSSTGKTIKKVGLKKGGKTVGCMMWFSDDIPSSNLERELVDLSVEGAVIEDPVYVDMVTGYVHDISRNCKATANGMEYTGLPMWDAPVLIINRNEVSFK